MAQQFTGMTPAQTRVFMELPVHLQQRYLRYIADGHDEVHLRHIADGYGDLSRTNGYGTSGSGEPMTQQQVSKEEQGPFPLGIFPPGSYPAQRQRLYENLPKQLKEAYRREATGQGPMSVDEKNAYVHLGDIQARMEETNTWIEMLMEQMEHMSGGRRFKDLEVWRAQLADQMKEWEDFAKEPVKVLGSVS